MTPTDVVTRLAAAFNARDLAQLSCLFTADGELFDEAGMRHRPAADDFAELFALWAAIEVRHRELYCHGDRWVWLARIHARARSVELELSAPYGYAIEMRDGLIATIRIFADEQQAFAAVGIDPTVVSPEPRPAPG